MPPSLDMPLAPTHNVNVETTKAQQARAASLARSLAINRRTREFIAQRLATRNYRQVDSTESKRKAS